MTSRPSRAAQALGYAGLIPFVGIALTALGVPTAYREVAGVALLTYAAAIVSFLGGIHWGMVMARPVSDDSTARLAWGVTPSLLAWGALLCPVRWGLVVAAASLATVYLVDKRTYPRADAQAWLPMRLVLTVVAAVSCLVAAGAA